MNHYATSYNAVKTYASKIMCYGAMSNIIKRSENYSEVILYFNFAL